MKTLNATMKQITLDSLFSEGGTLTDQDLDFFKTKKIRYDRGKYSETVIKRTPETDSIIWYQHSSDRYGCYIALWTVDDRRLTDAEKELYERAKEILNAKQTI